jgi:hypothetical protein
MFVSVCGNKIFKVICFRHDRYAYDAHPQCCNIAVLSRNFNDTLVGQKICNSTKKIHNLVKSNNYRKMFDKLLLISY